MLTGTPSLNMNGHQKTIGKVGKSGTPGCFLKKYGFSSAFQEFTYYKLKLREHEMCFESIVSGCFFFSSRDFIKTESNQNSAAEYKSY